MTSRLAAANNVVIGRASAGSERDVEAAVLDAVTQLIESGGHDGVLLREVARRARTGLNTIYKLFESRDDLIVRAIARWMATNAYDELAVSTPADDHFEGLMRPLRVVFEPWERSPMMLEAFHRARTGPGGERLAHQGFDILRPILHEQLADLDEADRADIAMILTNVSYGLVARFADGEIDITEILPSLERAVARIVDRQPHTTHRHH